MIEESFKIAEIGFYKTRSGKKAYVFDIDTTKRYPVSYCIENTRDSFTCHMDGLYNQAKELSIDIVGKWED